MTLARTGNRRRRRLLAIDDVDQGTRVDLRGQDVTHYYPNFGDGTTEYALMTCQS